MYKFTYKNAMLMLLSINALIRLKLFCALECKDIESTDKRDNDITDKLLFFKFSYNRFCFVFSTQKLKTLTHSHILFSRK